MGLGREEEIRKGKERSSPMIGVKKGGTYRDRYLEGKSWAPW